MRNLIAASAAFGLALSPIAANAGTRAGDVVPAAAKIERDTASIADKSELGGSAVLIALAAIAAVIAAIAMLADDDGISDG